MKENLLLRVSVVVMALAFLSTLAIYMRTNTEFQRYQSEAKKTDSLNNVKIEQLESDLFLKSNEAGRWEYTIDEMEFVHPEAYKWATKFHDHETE